MNHTQLPIFLRLARGESDSFSGETGCDLTRIDDYGVMVALPARGSVGSIPTRRNDVKSLINFVVVVDSMLAVAQLV